MTDVLVERSLVASVDGDDGCAICVEQSGCLDLHRARFSESYIDEGGRRLICHFHAPDVESVRMTLRNTGIDFDTIWSGTVHEGTEPATGNLVIEREFSSPLPEAVESALDLVKSEILTPLGLQLVRAFISCDRRRVVCLCQGTDSEPIGATQSQSKLPVDRLWSCRRVTTG